MIAELRQQPFFRDEDSYTVIDYNEIRAGDWIINADDNGEFVYWSHWYNIASVINENKVMLYYVDHNEMMLEIPQDVQGKYFRKNVNKEYELDQLLDADESLL